jgi:hypothetical protein
VLPLVISWVATRRSLCDAATLVDEPSTLIAIAVVLLVSVGLDFGWKRSRPAHIALT